jgi:hypothetical protein
VRFGRFGAFDWQEEAKVVFVTFSRQFSYSPGRYYQFRDRPYKLRRVDTLTRCAFKVSYGPDRPSLSDNSFQTSTYIYSKCHIYTLVNNHDFIMTLKGLR